MNLPSLVSITRKHANVCASSHVLEDVAEPYLDRLHLRRVAKISLAKKTRQLYCTLHARRSLIDKAHLASMSCTHRRAAAGALPHRAETWALYCLHRAESFQTGIAPIDITRLCLGHDRSTDESLPPLLSEHGRASSCRRGSRQEWMRQ